MRCCLFRRFGVDEAGRCVISERTDPRCWYTPLLDALTLEVLQLYPRLCTNRNTSSATLSRFEKAEFAIKKVLAQDSIPCDLNKCELFSVGVQTDAGFPVTNPMESQIAEENIVELLLEVAKTHSSEIPACNSEKPANVETRVIAPSVSGEIISSETVSVSLEMEIKPDSSNVSQESGGEKISISAVEKTEEDRASDALETGLLDKPNHLDTITDKRESQPRGILKLNLGNGGMEAVQEKPPEEATETSTEEGNISTLVASSKTVRFGKNYNDSANEREMEAEFLRLSLGFKCDLFTLDKRLRLEERSRDLAEENLRKEISNCLKLLETLIPVCVEDNQSREIIKNLEKSLQFLNQHTARVASRAELLGAIHQEGRVSKAVDVMIQHVENLKRMYAKEHAELEELKLVLVQKEKSFGSLGITDESPNKKIPSSKPSSLRRVSIASFPRSSGSPVSGLQFQQEMAGAEQIDKFQRRSTSWRLVGSKPNGNRPSLKRLISTCAWTDAEEHCLKGNESEQRPTDEEQSKKCLMEGRNPNAQPCPVALDNKKVHLPDYVGWLPTWASQFRTSFSKENITLWISLVVVVFLTALISFFTGLSFQRPVDAAPVGTGDSWTSLQQLLWPFTGLRHNGQPPV